MNLNSYLLKIGYNEGLSESMTLDSVNNIMENIGSSIITKENNLKYFKDFTDYNRQLDEMLVIKDSLEQLTKSYLNLCDKTSNAFYVDKLDDLNREISVSKHELDVIEKQLNQYTILKQGCEFIDQNDTVTVSNVDYCVDFLKMKGIRLNSKANDEFTQLIKKQLDALEQRIKQFLNQYFVNIIDFNQQNPNEITIIRNDYDEFIKFMAYITNITDSEEIITQLNSKLVEFMKHCLKAPKKLPQIIHESAQSIRFVLEEHKSLTDDLNNPKQFFEFSSKNIGNFVKFLDSYFPYFMVNNRSVDEINKSLILDFKKRLIQNMLKDLLTQSSIFCPNNTCSNILNEYLTYLINNFEALQTIDTSMKFVCNTMETFTELANEISSLNKLELKESTEVQLLDSLRLLFNEENFFLSIISIDRSNILEGIFPSDEASIFVQSKAVELPVNHPECWKKLLSRPCLLADYSCAIDVHEFVYKFVLLVAKFYFDEQNQGSHCTKYKIVRSAFKIFSFMIKHRFKECEGQISNFAIFYNDLQILNYFTMVLNLNFTSQISLPYPPIITLGDYIIEFDDIFDNLITSVLTHYNGLLVRSSNQFELSYLNNNVQKRISYTLRQIKDYLRDFSFQHQKIPSSVLEKYICILSNNVAEVVAFKITELSDIPEKNILPIVTLIDDIVDCFASCGLDISSNDKLSNVPFISQLQCIRTILKSNLYMIAQMWSDSSTASVDDKNLRSYLTREQLIKLIEAIFQESNIRADIIDKIRHE